MTEITDLSTTDSSNTTVTGESIDGAIANMGRMDNTLQAVMGLLARSIRTNVLRFLDNTDPTKKLAFDVSGITTGTTRTVTFPDANLNLASALSSGASNRIVNGSMTMSQENGNTLGTTNGYFPADQWAMYFTAATAAMSIQRIQARTLANAVNQLEYKCTTAKASLGASDNVLISQPIEAAWFQQAGYGTASAQRLVMRFQVSLPAGLYHWHFANSAGNRHCSVPFTIAGGEANTAVVKEIVVPPDTSGTWLTAEGVIGIVADLVLAAGATVTGGTASTWGGTTYYAASTQFNILSSTANVARLADVGLRLDPDATGVYGAYEVGEVDAVYRSERYFQKIFTPATIRGQYYTTTAASFCWMFPVKMCKAPTFNYVAAGIILGVGTATFTGGAVPFNGVDGVNFEATGSSPAATVNSGILFTGSGAANARLS